MDSSSVMHRWCNQDFGRNNTLTAQRSCHSEGRNYFSYSTVFGQWLDMKKKVVIFFDGSTSTTSSKYKLSKGYFPSDVHAFPYDDGGHYSWSGCNLVSEYNFSDENFKEYHRMQLINEWVGRLYEQFAAINGGKKKGLEYVDFDLGFGSTNYVRSTRTQQSRSGSSVCLRRFLRTATRKRRRQ